MTRSFLLPILLLLKTGLIHGFSSGANPSSPPASPSIPGAHPSSGEAGAPTEARPERPDRDRRSILSQLAASSLSLGSPLLCPARAASALPFGPGAQRRQLELCLVAVLRTQYWGMTTSKSLRVLISSPASAGGDDEGATEYERKVLDNLRKQPYLQARLGAKALLTQKIGGGASAKVEALATFQLKECLEDVKYWCRDLAKNNQLPFKEMTKMCSNDLVTACEDLVESLGSIVEFDGLETTVDPSPRSSLMLSMYNAQKGTFVYRTLVERVVPRCDQLLATFGDDRRRVVEDYVRNEYGGEVPFEVLEKMYD